MNPFQGMLLQLILKTAGYRRSTPKRRSSRSRRWSRAAQTLFASWAVLGQLGSMGVLVGEALTPLPALADTVPNSYGGTPTGTGASKNEPNTSNSRGSMALGFAASAGYDTDNLGDTKGTSNGSSIAIGTLSNAAQYGAVAIGIGAVTRRENQIVLGASTNLVGNSYTFAEANKTTVTVPNLSGAGNAIVIASSDGTLSRYEADRYMPCV